MPCRPRARVCVAHLSVTPPMASILSASLSSALGGLAACPRSAPSESLLLGVTPVAAAAAWGDELATTRAERELGAVLAASMTASPVGAGLPAPTSRGPAAVARHIARARVRRYGRSHRKRKWAGAPLTLLVVPTDVPPLIAKVSAKGREFAEHRADVVQPPLAEARLKCREGDDGRTKCPRRLGISTTSFAPSAWPSECRTTSPMT